MKLLFTSLLITLVFFSGCLNDTPKPSVNAKPLWIGNHTEGAIGICDNHLKGDAAQEEVAMDRAIQKLAKAKLSSVKTASKSSQHENSGIYRSNYNTATIINADTTVKSRIKETWRDPRTNRYYVWLVCD